MNRMLPLLALALLGSAAAAPGGVGVASTQKVIQMLTDMQAKGRQAKKDEEVAFAEFQTWCTQESANLKSDIAKNDEQIDLLDTEIMKLDSEVKALGEAIAKLSNDVASAQADTKAEEAKRAKDHAAFLEEEQDFSESVDALERAINVLQKENYDRPAGAAALMQLSGEDSRVPAQAKSIISAFVTMMDGGKNSDDPMGYAAPEANAYEFQSDSIINMLKKLRDEFRSKLGTAQKEEKNSAHAANMIIQDLKDTIENAQKDIEEKTQEKERKAQKSADNKKQLAATKKDKEENEKTLAAMTTECDEKTMSFQEKQNLRKEELEAIAKAIEILSSPDVLGNAEKHLSLAQQQAAASALVQVESETAIAPRRRVRDFLESEGVRLRSKNLAFLAEKLAADPFAKVKQLIDSMITRLLEEANADADHEGFCDKEMGKSKLTRNRLNEEIEALTAAVEDGKANILALTKDIQTLTKEVQDLVAAMGEATDLRKAEKAKNAQTVEDAQAAQKAVAAATAVLKEFYEKASTATGFLQVSMSAPPTQRAHGLKKAVKMGSEEWNELANPNYESGVAGSTSAGHVDTGHKEGMQTFGETEYGQQDEASYGVMALLEVVQSDFARLEADTQAAEAASQKAFDDFMIQSKRSKAVKDRKIEMNNADKAAAEAKLSTDIADLKATQDELLAAERYHAKLVPQCIDQGQTFDERTASRAEEIASLKKALEILSSPDIATSA